MDDLCVCGALVAPVEHIYQQRNDKSASCNELVSCCPRGGFASEPEGEVEDAYL